MNDLDDPIHDHFRALALQYAEPIVPPNGLLEAIRRRRHRRQLVAVAGAAAAVAAIAVAVPHLVTTTGPGHPPRPSSSQPPAPSSVLGRKPALRNLSNGPVTQPISIDGGRLRITPPAAGYQPAIPARQARQTATRATRAEGGWVTTTGAAYGEVSIASSLTHGLPAYQSRPAWITVLTPSPSVGCPAVGGARPGAPTAVRVILTDADSGAASLIYTSRGAGICQYPIRQPSVAIAEQMLSIPWTLLGERPDSAEAGHVDWHIAFRMPSCARLMDSPSISYNTAGRPVLLVLIELPIDRPTTCTAGTRRTDWFGPESQQATTVKHAPTGNTVD